MNNNLNFTEFIEKCNVDKITVKNFIELLKTLDQDKYIYIEYDSGYDRFPPFPDKIDINGDYVITAG